MPYIPEAQKQLLTKPLADLNEVLKGISIYSLESTLKYVVTDIVERRMGRNGWRYKLLARTKAVLTEARDEFLRRSPSDSTTHISGESKEKMQGHEKKSLDQPLNNLHEVLNSFSDEDIEGVLNYTTTDVVVRRLQPDLLGLAKSIFTEARNEFSKRVVGPYEDNCIKKNGDIEVYETPTLANT